MRAAVFDIGTNTVRCLVSEDGLEVLRGHRVVRLGKGVDASGRFDPGAIDRAATGLADLMAAAGAPERVDAVATSATRDAANRDVFLARAEAVLGVRPRVIGGEVEADLSFRGATSAGLAAPVLVIDVGGGSTEFVLGDTAPEYGVSVDVGSVRLTERVIPDRPADNVTEALEVALDLMAPVDLPRPPATVIGVAGTFTALAAIDLHLEAYDRSLVHHHRLTVAAMEHIVEHLAGLTLQETAAIPSLEPARAPMLLGGAIVVLAALRTAGADSVIVSEHDLLDGLMADLLANRTPGVR